MTILTNCFFREYFEKFEYTKHQLHCEAEKHISQVLGGMDLYPDLSSGRLPAFAVTV